MKTDKLVYLLFQHLPQGFFALVGRTAADGEQYEFKSVELKETAFRLDAVFAPRDETEPTYFVEAQFQRDGEFYARFFAEIFLYLKQYPVAEWQAVAIYPSRDAEQTDFGAYRELLGAGVVRRIYLDELPDIADLDAPVGLFKLLIEPEARAPSSARTVLQKEPEYADIVLQILSYKFSTRNREEVRDMLGLKEEFLKETQYYKDIFKEGRLEGKQEGKLEGKQEGKLEGKQEGKLETVSVLRELGLSDEVIAEKLQLPLPVIQAVKAVPKT